MWWNKSPWQKIIFLLKQTPYKHTETKSFFPSDFLLLVVQIIFTIKLFHVYLFLSLSLSISSSSSWTVYFCRVKQVLRYVHTHSLRTSYAILWQDYSRLKVWAEEEGVRRFPRDSSPFLFTLSLWPKMCVCVCMWVRVRGEGSQVSERQPRRP